MVRAFCAFSIFTWKCASRHNGVHFFNMSTSKSGPSMFLTFPRGNVLRATRACTFSTCQLSKVVRTSCVFSIFHSCFAPQRRAIFHLSSDPQGSAPAALASLLLDPPEPQISGKNSESRLSYLFPHLPLLSSHSFSFLIFFFSSPLWLFPILLFQVSIVHIVGSFTSKPRPPSIIIVINKWINK